MEILSGEGVASLPMAFESGGAVRLAVCGSAEAKERTRCASERTARSSKLSSSASAFEAAEDEPTSPYRAIVTLTKSTISR